MADETAKTGRALVFRLDQYRFALPLAAVRRVVRSVASTALPQAPAIVRGVIDLRGEVVAVIDLRARLGLPGREAGLDDQLLIARTPRRTVALPVDRSEGVVAWRGDDFAAAGQLAPGTKYLKGILRGAEGLILVHDLDALLSLEEEEAIDAALDRAP